MLDKETYKKILYFNSRTIFTKEEVFKEIGAENLMKLFAYSKQDEIISAF